MENPRAKSYTLIWNNDFPGALRECPFELLCTYIALALFLSNYPDFCFFFFFIFHHRNFFYRFSKYFSLLLLCSSIREVLLVIISLQSISIIIFNFVRPSALRLQESSFTSAEFLLCEKKKRREDFHYGQTLLRGGLVAYFLPDYLSVYTLIEWELSNYHHYCLARLGF